MMVNLKLSLPKIRERKVVLPSLELEGLPVEETLVDPIPTEMEVSDEYWIKEKYARVVIGKPAGSSETVYYIDEVTPNNIEKGAYQKISDIIAKELNPAEIGKEEDVRRELLEEVKRLGIKYQKAFKEITPEGWDKINYYLERDLLGFGTLNTLMSDYRIEDISCDGVDVPIFIWHRRYESIPTNIRFLNKDGLDDYIVKLAHKSGKHVSSAFPIVDAMLFGKHRLAASFRDEVSPKGSTFAIRKFREEPFSIIDLIQMSTMSEEMAAYLWMLIENRATLMVIGGTGSGKTTTLNALASLIKPGMKIVTVEETPELNLPHENWVQFVSRESYGLTGSKVGLISLMDLVKTSLRYRPDYLVVGEVRGEEAYVLFQAMATGHGGLTTLHGENIEYAIRRLISPPMNVSETYIPLINAVAFIERVTLPGTLKVGRRMRMAWEIEEFDKYLNMYSWSPQDDVFLSNVRDSIVLRKIGEKLGKSRTWIFSEMERRKSVLHWMSEKGIRNVNDVARIVYQYYSNPEELMSKIGEEPVKAEELEAVLAAPPAVAAEPYAVSETQAPARFLEEPLMKIYEILNAHSGTASIEMLVNESGIDEVTLWRFLNILKSFRHVSVVEKKEGEKFSTFFVLSDRATGAYETLKARLGK